MTEGLTLCEVEALCVGMADELVEADGVILAGCDGLMLGEGEGAHFDLSFSIHMSRSFGPSQVTVYSLTGIFAATS